MQNAKLKMSLSDGVAPCNGGKKYKGDK